MHARAGWKSAGRNFDSAARYLRGMKPESQLDIRPGSRYASIYTHPRAYICIFFLYTSFSFYAYKLREVVAYEI
jgi:hypothetical protein